MCIANNFYLNHETLCNSTGEMNTILPKGQMHLFIQFYDYCILPEVFSWLKS